MNNFSPDRAAGVLLGQACGDALGVPYEFGPALDADFIPELVGGGPFGFAPGEYSDDTAMGVCIAEVAASGADLATPTALDMIASNFLEWAKDANDIGNQTRSVFDASRSLAGTAGERLIEASRRHAELHPGRVGNGALMRTSIVGLTRLHDRNATAAAARAVAALTHADPLAIESCVLWAEAIRLAVTIGRLDLAAGLDLINPAHQARWRSWIDESTGVDPRTFNPNGFTVTALQAAWAAITWTPVPELDLAAGSFPAQHFELALRNAVRAGNDTDTVAAIAGGLLGAYWGQSAIPFRLNRHIHGYGGNRAHDLIALAALTANEGRPDHRGWPTAPHITDPAYLRGLDFAAAHPHDDGVVLGTYNTTEHGCDAIVSLCRLGSAEIPASGVAATDHLELRLIDSENPADNPHLDFVFAEIAAAIATLRSEDHRVFVHCVAAEQRAPTAGIAYSRLLGIDVDAARAGIGEALPRLRGYGLLWEAAASVPRGILPSPR